MKIAVITPDYPPNATGGCAASACLLASELREKRHKIDVFAFAQKSNQTVYHQNTGTDNYIKGYPKIDLLNAIIIYNTLNKRLKNYDIAIVYNLGPLIGMAPLKKKIKIPIIAVLNNLGGATPNPVEQFKSKKQDSPKWVKALWLSLKYHDIKAWPFGTLVHWVTFLMIRRAVRKADHYVALTQAIQDLYEKAGCNHKKFTIIPNMVDISFLAKKTRKESKKVHIAFVGQLSPKKGALDFLRAFLSLPDSIRGRAKISIIGKGKEEKIIKTIARESNSDITVKALNHKELPNFFSTVDVMVHPAKWMEPFSRIWLEAMASGCAILSSNNPSANEVLQNTALFFDVLDPLDFQIKLKSIILNKSLRNGLKVKSEEAAQKFLPKTTLPKWEKCLSEIAQQH